MSDLLFYDAATPPAHPPHADGVAFYIGGDAAHVWTAAEIGAATPRYRLPIYVRSHPAGASAHADTAEALRALHNIGAPRGCLVAWDTETAADPGYMAVVYTLLAGSGYRLLDYGSQDDLFANQLPVGGYYWGADWTGERHINPGEAGTQYANDGEYDLSIFKPGLPFWDTRPDNWTETIVKQLPTLTQYTSGNAVRTLQGLLVARDFPITVDGKFGQETELAVRQIQTEAAITVDGIVGPQTWPVLLGV